MHQMSLILVPSSWSYDGKKGSHSQECLMYCKNTSVRSLVRKVQRPGWSVVLLPSIAVSTYHILSKHLPTSLFPLLGSDALWGRNCVLLIFMSLRVLRMVPILRRCLMWKMLVRRIDIDDERVHGRTAAIFVSQLVRIRPWSQTAWLVISPSFLVAFPLNLLIFKWGK